MRIPTVKTRNIYVDERGVAWIEGTTTKVVEVVLDKIAYGLTPEQMHEAHPHWSLAQIHAALSYYYDHADEIDAQIERDLREVDEMRIQQEKTMGESPVRKRLREMGKLPPGCTSIISMSIQLYMDENVNGGITRGLRRRGLNVLTC